MERVVWVRVFLWELHDAENAAASASRSQSLHIVRLQSLTAIHKFKVKVNAIGALRRKI